MTGPLCEPILNVALLVELFDQRHKYTVYRWNISTNGSGKRLPPADLVVGDVALWKVSTILSWAEAKKERVNPRVLERILAEQS